MNESSRRDLGVFDFNEEDELADLASEKQLNKFKTSTLDDQSFFNDDELLRNNEKGVSDPIFGKSEGTFGDDDNSELEASQQSKDTSSVVPSAGMSQIHIALSGSPSSDGSADVYSEANGCMNESAPSTPVSDIAENVSSNYYGLSHWRAGSDSDMDDANLEVVLYPDYIIYQGNFYMGTKLTFSRCCLKMDGLTACVKQGATNLEWAVDDVVDIRCQLFQNNGVVMMKIRVITSIAGLSNNVNETAGIEELKIVIADSNWSCKHEQITSLNVKYLAIWNTSLDVGMEGDGSDLIGPKCYLPNFDEPFGEVIYPKGDPDAVSLSKRDVDLLQPDTFINDTIIDFYIKYLKNQINEDKKHKFHFFNSFFFRKLADMDKNPSSASDGKAAFLRVRKWTRKVNLFEKDYIFIPVNFNLHWSLLVICHPGEVVTFNEECVDESLKVPCILHMDSIKGSHSGLQNLVRSYLREEWKERQKDKWHEDLSSRFSHMRFLPLALPQQENAYDCGLFLLHYLELFLAEVPENFNPLKLTKFSNFLNVEWFLPEEAYLKRTLIQKLIFKLLKDRSGVSTTEYSDDHHYIENNENRTGVHFLGKGFDSGVIGEPTTSHAGQGIEITLLSPSSSLDPHSGMVLRDLFEPGATAGELLEQCQSFHHKSSDYRLNGSMFPIEEGTETGEQFMYLTTDANFQQVAAITPQTCELPYLSRDSGGFETCHQPEITIQAERDKAESSRDASGCASDDSDDIGVIQNFPVGNEAGSSEDKKQDEYNNCSSIENFDTLTEISGSARTISNFPTSTVLGCSEDSIMMCGSNKNEALPVHQDSDVVDEKDTSDVQTGNEICEEQAAKRRRLMPLESESDSLGSLKKEPCL